MSTLKVNTLQEATAGGATFFTAKAWVNFNGTSTVSIRDDGNVSSITDNGTGDYTINFSSTLSSSSYGINTGGRRFENNFTESGMVMGSYGSGNFPTSFNRMLTYDNDTNGRQDCVHVCFGATL